MARVAIAYAHSSQRREQTRPITVVAQDDDGVVIVPIAQDLQALARSIGVPPLTYTGWTLDLQDRVEPQSQWNALTRTYDELPVTDIRWLEHLIAPTLLDTVSFGPITERSGNATEVATALASELAPAGS